MRLELIGLIQRTHGFVEDYHERTFGLQHDGIQSTGWSPGDEVAVRRVMERADRLRWLWTYGEYLAANPLDRRGCTRPGKFRNILQVRRARQT